MKLKIVEHYSQENGKFLCYELKYKPCWWWPVWRRFTDSWTKDKTELYQNIAFAFMLDGTLVSEREYN